MPTLDQSVPAAFGLIGPGLMRLWGSQVEACGCRRLLRSPVVGPRVQADDVAVLLQPRQPSQELIRTQKEAKLKTDGFYKVI